jgi:hypothetical protein
MGVFTALYKPAREVCPWWILEMLRSLKEQGLDYPSTYADGNEFVFVEDLHGSLESGILEENEVELVCPKCQNAEGIGNRRVGCEVCGGDFLAKVNEWLKQHDGQIIRISW